MDSPQTHRRKPISVSPSARPTGEVPPQSPKSPSTPPTSLRKRATRYLPLLIPLLPIGYAYNHLQPHYSLMRPSPGDVASASRAYAILDDQCKDSQMTGIGDRIDYYLGMYKDCELGAATCPGGGEDSPVFMEEGVSMFDTKLIMGYPEMWAKQPICVPVDDWKGELDKVTTWSYGKKMYRYFAEIVHGAEVAGVHGHVAAQFGDGIKPLNCPCLRKVRMKGEGSPVLFKMAYWRHWTGVADVTWKDSTPFKQKKNVAVWRGTTTGGKDKWPTKYYNDPDDDPKGGSYHTRAELMRRSPLWNGNPAIDVGVVEYTQGVPNLYGRSLPKLRYQMLDYKMLLVPEGNDVATALKWSLLSTSAVIMPEATILSWLMEDELVPWVHYLPVERDWSDLEEKVNWCIRNEKECEGIGMAGRCYMQQFFHLEREKEIARAVFARAAAAQEQMGTCVEGGR